MIIKYTNFSDGIHEFQLSDSAKNLGLEEKFLGSVVVNCKMDKSPHQIVLGCDLEITAKLACDRCGKEIEKNFTNHFQISYLFSRNSEKNDDFNLKFLSPEQDKINITEDVFEYSELALPMKILCNDECKGICPTCGKNLNEEVCNCEPELEKDIWEPLKKLKGKLGSTDSV